MIPGVGLNIALYFFLAGTGVGMYLATYFVRWRGGFPQVSSDNRAAELALSFLPIMLVAAGTLFLFYDLGVPSNAHLVLLKPFKSTISFGAWSVLVFMVLGCAYEMLARLGIYLPSPAWTVLRGSTVVAACCVALYTGAYLFRTSAVPFWHTPSVVLLFGVSSLTCGFAALGIVLFFGMPRSRRPVASLAGPSNVLVVCEALLLCWFCVSRCMAPGNAPELLCELLAGGHAQMFWFLVVLCGMVIPAGLRFAAPRTDVPVLWLVSSFFALAGGLALRCSIILI